eukprot:9934449-Lingulodinium_polyedra.AAC.1
MSYCVCEEFGVKFFITGEKVANFSSECFIPAWLVEKHNPKDKSGAPTLVLDTVAHDVTVDLPPSLLYQNGPK